MMQVVWLENEITDPYIGSHDDPKDPSWPLYLWYPNEFEPDGCLFIGRPNGYHGEMEGLMVHRYGVPYEDISGAYAGPDGEGMDMARYRPSDGAIEVAGHSTELFGTSPDFEQAIREALGPPPDEDFKFGSKQMPKVVFDKEEGEPCPYADCPIIYSLDDNTVYVGTTWDSHLGMGLRRGWEGRKDKTGPVTWMRYYNGFSDTEGPQDGPDIPREVQKFLDDLDISQQWNGYEDEVPGVNDHSEDFKFGSEFEQTQLFEPSDFEPEVPIEVKVIEHSVPEQHPTTELAAHDARAVMIAVTKYLVKNRPGPTAGITAYVGEPNAYHLQMIPSMMDENIFDVPQEDIDEYNDLYGEDEVFDFQPPESMVRSYMRSGYKSDWARGEVNGRPVVREIIPARFDPDYGLNIYPGRSYEPDNYRDYFLSQEEEQNLENKIYEALLQDPQVQQDQPGPLGLQVDPDFKFGSTDVVFSEDEIWGEEPGLQGRIPLIYDPNTDRVIIGQDNQLHEELSKEFSQRNGFGVIGFSQMWLDDVAEGTKACIAGEWRDGFVEWFTGPDRRVPDEATDAVIGALKDNEESFKFGSAVPDPIEVTDPQAQKDYDEGKRWELPLKSVLDLRDVTKARAEEFESHREYVENNVGDKRGDGIIYHQYPVSAWVLPDEGGGGWHIAIGRQDGFHNEMHGFLPPGVGFAQMNLIDGRFTPPNDLEFYADKDQSGIIPDMVVALNQLLGSESDFKFGSVNVIDYRDEPLEGDERSHKEFVRDRTDDETLFLQYPVIAWYDNGNWSIAIGREDGFHREMPAARSNVWQDGVGYEDVGINGRFTPPNNLEFYDDQFDEHWGEDPAVPQEIRQEMVAELNKLLGTEPNEDFRFGRTRHCPPIQDRQWNCPLCDGPSFSDQYKNWIQSFPEDDIAHEKNLPFKAQDALPRSFSPDGEVLEYPAVPGEAPAPPKPNNFRRVRIDSSSWFKRTLARFKRGQQQQEEGATECEECGFVHKPGPCPKSKGGPMLMPEDPTAQTKNGSQFIFDKTAGDDIVPIWVNEDSEVVGSGKANFGAIVNEEDEFGGHSLYYLPSEGQVWIGVNSYVHHMNIQRAIDDSDLGDKEKIPAWTMYNRLVADDSGIGNPKQLEVIRNIGPEICLAIGLPPLPPINFTDGQPHEVDELPGDFKFGARDNIKIPKIVEVGTKENPDFPDEADHNLGRWVDYPVTVRFDGNGNVETIFVGRKNGFHDSLDIPPMTPAELRAGYDGDSIRYEPGGDLDRSRMDPRWRTVYEALDDYFGVEVEENFKFGSENIQVVVQDEPVPGWEKNFEFSDIRRPILFYPEHNTVAIGRPGGFHNELEEFMAPMKRERDANYVGWIDDGDDEVIWFGTPGRKLMWEEGATSDVTGEPFDVLKFDKESVNRSILEALDGQPDFRPDDFKFGFRFGNAS